MDIICMGFQKSLIIGSCRSWVIQVTAPGPDLGAGSKESPLCPDAPSFPDRVSAVRHCQGLRTKMKEKDTEVQCRECHMMLPVQFKLNFMRISWCRFQLQEDFFIFIFSLQEPALFQVLYLRFVIYVPCLFCKAVVILNMQSFKGWENGKNVVIKHNFTLKIDSKPSRSVLIAVHKRSPQGLFPSITQTPQRQSAGHPVYGMG